MNHLPPRQDGQHRRMPASRRYWLVFAGFALIALFFLWQEHRAHLLGSLPWIFLLLCPLMHLFMHRGHGSHGRSGRGED